MGEARDRLLKMAKELNITGLVAALESKEVQQQCKDMQDFGWILCSSGIPTSKEGYLPGTNGKEQWLGYYNSKAKRWVVEEESPFRADKIVAWTYNNDLGELQEYLKTNV